MAALIFLAIHLLMALLIFGFVGMLIHDARPRRYIDPTPIDEAVQFNPLPLDDKDARTDARRPDAP